MSCLHQIKSEFNMSLRTQMRYLNPYELHKLIVNEYVLQKPGDTKVLKRNSSRDRNDYDVLRDHHKFLWNDDDKPQTWEEQFAKKYYEKLFREYCIADLSLYKENKIALRWRTEQEVVVGRGQFSCGNKRCNEKEGLRSWEVNFAYKEQEERKNALVKLRLCSSCSKKLNYYSKKREVKRLKDQKKHTESKLSLDPVSLPNKNEEQEVSENSPSSSSNNDCKLSEPVDSWQQQTMTEIKSREDEMEEYLQDLLL